MGYVECSISECGNPVFATGVCRKHYEQARLATAAPCSIDNCAARSYRGDLCITHYRLFTLSKRPKCVVPNCGNPQKNLTNQLCGKHEFRVRRHGAIQQTRSPDWGSRESHPLYGIWAWHKRKGAVGMCNEWRENFWVFVEAVKEKPADHQLRRPDSSRPLGPGNWLWHETIKAPDAASRQREWRNRNPEKAKSHDLKKMYGIRLEQYEALAQQQNHVCAICQQPEKSLDKDGGPRKMPVDHCHETGKVRGLLCTPCNRALGMFRDDANLLKRAIEYLHKAVDTPSTT